MLFIVGTCRYYIFLKDLVIKMFGIVMYLRVRWTLLDCSNIIFIILCSGKNAKDKAYKLSSEYPFRANAVKVVLSFAHTLYNTQNVVIDVSTRTKMYNKTLKIYHLALQVSQYMFNHISSWYMKQGITFYLVAPINLSSASNDEIFGEYIYYFVLKY